MVDPFIKNVCAVAVGNILEWYDFAIFGALADILGYRFFPKHFSSTALVASLSLFGSAFFMRPIGGLLMGYVGDNYGRKRALEFSVAMMVVPSFFMGCLPTFQQCGYFATVVLILLRLMQGTYALYICLFLIYKWYRTCSRRGDGGGIRFYYRSDKGKK